jgi:hypothetical protein
MLTRETIISDKRPDKEHTPHQHIRFNLQRHRGVVSNMPTIQLFREFTSVLRSGDPLLTLLPYEASKQHYSSINTSRQIQTIDISKMNLLFRSYYQKQMYSLSGFFHIRTALSFQDLITSTPVVEWLDIYHDYIKLCTSQEEEIVQIGALCYSNILMHREELKQAIMQHTLWNTLENPLVFDVYISDFLEDNKKTKMLFISTEKSKQDEAEDFFKCLYEGSPKEYPNGSTTIFIPLKNSTDITTSDCTKILFNHDKSNGDEEATCIGGLQDLNQKIHPN